MVLVPKEISSLTLEDQLLNRRLGAHEGLRVLFVYANTAGDPLVPVGIPQLYSLLKEGGHDARLFDTTWWKSSFFAEDIGNKERAMRLVVKPTNPSEVGLGFHEGDVFDAFEREVATYQPDLIAISALEMTAKFGFALSDYVRKRGYIIPTIVGGEYATTSKDLVFEFDDDTRAVDMICVGEGELPFTRLLESLSRRSPSSDEIRKIPGLWIRDNTSFGYSKPLWGRAIPLDDLPLGDINIFLDPKLGGDPKIAFKPMYGKWWKSFTVEKARGCHFKCSFCAQDVYHEMYTQNKALRLDPNNPATKNQFRRDKSMKRFIADALSKKNDHGMEFTYIMDEDAIPPTGHGGVDRIREFTELYDFDVALPFWLETRPESITKEVIDELSRHCLGISVGVESGSPEIRSRVMRRGMKQEKISEAIRVLANRGIPHVSANMIVGTPYVKDGQVLGETREQFFESVRLAKELREIYPVVVPTWNLFQPYRGTSLRDDMVVAGLISRDHICGDYRTSTGAVGLGDLMSREEQIGLYRAAALYTHFPESRWNEVRDAEMDDETFFGLVEEATGKYFKDQSENSQTPPTREWRASPT